MIRITGDINLTDGYFDMGFGIGSQLKNKFDPFKYIERDKFDFWIGNFEGVSSDSTNKKGIYASQFRISPQYIAHLNHFNFYGLANNHVMQHGNKAYYDTVQVLESMGAQCFGMNENKSAVIKYNENIVSITGLSLRIDSFSDSPEYWHNPDFIEIEDEIRKLPSNAFKILYVHWGNEFINYPSTCQKNVAHWIIDLGVDLIIGMHPHVLQGFEVYKNKYIFYSIGNFIFNMPWEPCSYGVILNVDFKCSSVNISYDYVKISDSMPSIVLENEIPTQYRFSYLNKLIDINENSEEYHHAIDSFYKKYRKSNWMNIFRNFLSHPTNSIIIIKDFINRRLIN